MIISNQQRNQQLLGIYNGYRILLAILFLAATFTDIGQQLVTFSHLERFQVFSVSYALINILVALVSNRVRTRAHYFAVCCLDILLLTTLIFLSGNKSAVLGNLIIIAVAAGNVLITGRAGTLLAAIATLGMLGTSLYYTVLRDTPMQGHINAGVLGLLFFASAFVMQSLAERLRRSEQQRLEQQDQYRQLQQLNHSIIQRMRTGILVVDDHRQIVLMNEAAAQMLDCPQKSAPLNLVSPELNQRLQNWIENPTLRGEPFKVRPNTPTIQANFTELEPMAGQRHRLVFLDDTLMLAQQAQQLKLASLGRLTASIAHEIRNPLGAISHAAQLMQESPDLPEGDLRLLEIIQNHSRRMNRIIENVLQLSRRRASLTEQFSLNQWLRQYIEEYRLGGPPDTRIDLDASEEIEVRMDRDQFTQVLSNLCQNGLRYSVMKNGHPTLRLHTGVKADTGHPYLDVIDQGPGVPEAIREHLFEPFYTTETNGTGLGLYLSRELCEANHASLELLESEAGCRFRITFPHPEKRIH
ncbi:two-component system sensor histidine kinase NtrB [Aestuariirhabdus litorea]|uniref:histidine kinase n=1 Tax=Aestuariirhabdus litorea TaxID=2528527 RepID=A0A3P3VKK3_9GAMM|nr:ATP-binding protein [Aestuariirhabdus litorea]RRJ83262.1 PAS domain-containing protein [Aestuariirhabdus litorea]RWW93421.1 PAS domain-containing protein [Endozoicomonadaceae bacterium GTF-13]